MFLSKLTVSHSDGPKALREGGFRDNGDLQYTHEQEREGKSPGPALDRGMGFESQVSIQRGRLRCCSSSSAPSKESISGVGANPCQDSESSQSPSYVTVWSMCCVIVLA